jgi:hypothetical protein
LQETINSFSVDTEEVSFCVDTKRLLIKNYVEPENVEMMSKIVNTQVSFDCDEFEIFHIGNEKIKILLKRGERMITTFYVP